MRVLQEYFYILSWKVRMYSQECREPEFRQVKLMLKSAVSNPS